MGLVFFYWLVIKSSKYFLYLSFISWIFLWLFLMMWYFNPIFFFFLLRNTINLRLSIIKLRSLNLSWILTSQITLPSIRTKIRLINPTWIHSFFNLLIKLLPNLETFCWPLVFFTLRYHLHHKRFVLSFFNRNTKNLFFFFIFSF